MVNILWRKKTNDKRYLYRHIYIYTFISFIFFENNVNIELSVLALRIAFILLLLQLSLLNFNSLFTTMTLFIIFTLLLTLPFSSNGFWILSHSPLVSQRLDPIISGNGTSGHTHTFVGDSDILGDSQNKSCTTSVVKGAFQMLYYIIYQ